MSKYKKWYDSIVMRAKNRKLTIPTECHHIVPVCMGGLDDPENLVELTPEEHYVCHQILVKMYPENSSLVFAANMMNVKNELQNRSGNKAYGWLRRKVKSFMSEKQKNTVHIHKDGKQKKVKKDKVEKYLIDGWLMGNLPRTKEHKEKISITRLKNGSKNKTDYLKNPDKCHICNADLPYVYPNKRKKRLLKMAHCGSSSCRKKFSSNIGKIRTEKSLEKRKKYCKACGKHTFNPKYCSLDCAMKTNFPNLSPNKIGN